MTPIKDINVQPYTRKVKGKDQNVSGYSYKRDCKDIETAIKNAKKRISKEKGKDLFSKKNITRNQKQETLSINGFIIQDVEEMHIFAIPYEVIRYKNKILQADENGQFHEVKDTSATKKIENLDDLSQLEVYHKWINNEKRIRYLVKELEKESDPNKVIETEKELHELENETNTYYNTFRHLLEDQIHKESEEWSKDYYDALYGSHRFKYRTVENIQSKHKIKTISNPTLDNLFKKSIHKDIAPVYVMLSDDGKQAFLRFDNKSLSGAWKSSYGTFNDYQYVIRDKYHGAWDNTLRVNKIPIEQLENALMDLKASNSQLTYNIGGKLEDWKEKAELPKTVTDDKDFLILEVNGKIVKIKGKSKDVQNAVKYLNTEYTREIKYFDPNAGHFETERIPAVELKGDTWTYSIGLLDESFWNLELNGMKPVLDDKRPRKPISSPDLKNLDLRDYQKRAISEALIEGDGLIVAPTGSGKTEIATGITSAYIEGAKQNNEETDVLFLVHRGTLGKQAEERFEKRLGIEVGRIAGDKDINHPLNTPKSDVNIASLQSLAKAIDDSNSKEKYKEMIDILDEADVIIQDEAHHVTAKSFDKVFSYNPTRHKYGLTATPDREDTEAIMKVMKIGSKRPVASLKELQDRGFLMKPKVITITIPESPNVNPYLKHAKKFQNERKCQIIENESRNKIAMDLSKNLLKEDKTTILFVYQKNHGNLLKKKFKEQGLVVPFMFGGNNKTQKQINLDTIKNLETGKVKLAIATTSLIGEGFDLPELDACVIADANGKSKIDVLQRAGRTMRIKEGKKQPLIYEFRDKSETLERHYEERMTHYIETNAFDYEEMKKTTN